MCKCKSNLQKYSAAIYDVSVHKYNALTTRIQKNMVKLQINYLDGH